MRIVIDMQGAQTINRFREEGRNSLSLALAMSRNAGEHEIWLALNGAFPESVFAIRHAFNELIPQERIRVFEVPAPVAEAARTNAWRTRAAEIIREHYLQQLKPDVVHVSSLFEGYEDDAVASVGVFASGLCTAVTLYDQIPLLNQRDDLNNDIRREYYLRKVGYLKNADLIFAISEATRSAAIEALQLPPSQVVNISTVADGVVLSDAIFDPDAPQAIAEKIALALSDQSLRAHDLNQVKNFSWDECARRAINALEILAQAKRTALISTEEVETISELVGSIAEINNARRPTDYDLVRVADCLAFNTGHAGPKQLLLDISEMVKRDAKAGIQRVVRSLLRGFIVNPPQDTEVRPIYFDGTCYKYASAYTASFMGKPSQEVADEIVDFCQDDIYLALDLNPSMTAAVHDFHMHLQCRGIKLYFIVYDILLVQHPEWWPVWTSVIFEAWLQSISKVASGLICISASVAEEVRAWLAQNPPQRLSGPQVSSFHLGADVENSLPSKGMPEGAQEVLAALSVKPSFLMVGTIEPRKAHAQVLAAFDLLWGQDIDVNLVIVGKQGWLVDHLVGQLRRHSELNQRMFWLEGISDEYLEKVYSASTCLIFASEGEGFGLPLIEAAQHNKSIIARDIPVLREVAGEHALYFSGRAPEDLADTIKTWLALNQKGMHPKSEGMHYLTWQESALQLKKQLGLDITPYPASAA